MRVAGDQDCTAQRYRLRGSSESKVTGLPYRGGALVLVTIYNAVQMEPAQCGSVSGQDEGQMQGSLCALV